jgi:hypothetical protein
MHVPFFLSFSLSLSLSLSLCVCLSLFCVYSPDVRYSVELKVSPSICCLDMLFDVHNLPVAQKRNPGKSGYYGVAINRGRYVAQIRFEVQAHHKEACQVTGNPVGLLYQLHPKHAAVSIPRLANEIQRVVAECKCHGCQWMEHLSQMAECVQR